MFTGIIEQLGQVKRISKQGKTSLLAIKADFPWRDLKTGESISVNGVCLTLTENKTEDLIFDVMPETLKITNLGFLKINDKVNLERALKAGDRISGHFVSGHIDCIGIIRCKGYRNNNLAFEIAFPGEFTKYIMPKGSIAVDGISLTVADKRSGVFFVYIIPHTLKNTTLNFKGPSDKVNIEFWKIGTATIY